MTITEIEELDNDVLVAYMCVEYYRKQLMIQECKMNDLENISKNLDNFKYVLFKRLGGTRYHKLKAASISNKGIE